MTGVGNKRKQKWIDEINAMSDDERIETMTKMITDDLIGFIEPIIKRRVGLFMTEIRKGVQLK